MTTKTGPERCQDYVVVGVVGVLMRAKSVAPRGDICTDVENRFIGHFFVNIRNIYVYVIMENFA